MRNANAFGVVDQVLRRLGVLRHYELVLVEVGKREITARLLGK